MATDTRPLSTRWEEYRDPSYVPRAFVDEVRHSILTRGEYEIDEDARADVTSAAISVLRRLGYEIDVEDGRYVCANRDHTPTASDWARTRPRSKERGASAAIARREDAPPPTSNGSVPTPSRRRRAERFPGGPTTSVAAMLPHVADSLVVAAVGFRKDGTPFLAAIGSDGRRYECAIERVES